MLQMPIVKKCALVRTLVFWGIFMRDSVRRGVFPHVVVLMPVILWQNGSGFVGKEVVDCGCNIISNARRQFLGYFAACDGHLAIQVIHGSVRWFSRRIGIVAG